MCKIPPLKTVLLTISSMIATYMASDLVILAIIIGAVTLWGLRKNSLLILEKHKGGRGILSCVITLVLLVNFHLFLVDNIDFVKQRLPLSETLVDLIFWVVCAICAFIAFFFVQFAVRLLFNQQFPFEEQPVNSAKSISWKEVGFMFICALLTITICSQCSFLYPINLWVDPNVYFTVALGMKEGLVPYLDMLDHKGPILYFIHLLGALIHSRSLIGIYIIQILFSSVFLYWSLRTIRLFKSDADVIIVAPVAAIVYSSVSYYTGDSCEEFCLPLLAYVIYSGMKNNLMKSLPTNVESLIIGVCAAFVFWNKFSVCGIFVGWYLPVLISSLKEKRWKDLILISFSVGLGLIILTIPILGYFYAFGGLNDLFTVYFGYNLFQYNDVGSDVSSPILLLNLFMGLTTFIRSFICFILVVLAFIILRKHKERAIFFSFCSMFAFAYFSIFFAGGYKWHHYALILLPFSTIGLVFIISYIHNWFVHIPDFIKRTPYLSAILSSLLFSYLISYGTFAIGDSRDKYPQHIFAKYIEETNKTSLLEFYDTMHSGFNTSAGIAPNTKYFKIVNCCSIKEQQLKQDSIVTNGLVDIIITGKEENFQKYHCVAHSIYCYNNHPLFRYLVKEFVGYNPGQIDYFLYELNEDSKPE